MQDLIMCAPGFLYTLIYSAIYVLSKHIYRIQKQSIHKSNQQELKLIRKQQQEKQIDKKKARYQRRQFKILLMGAPTVLCMIHSYNNLCSNQSSTNTRWDWFGCLKLANNEQIAWGIVISFYMNTVLYIGPIYQEIWNGNLRKKFAKLNFNKFRWDYFTKIVITPLIEEILFRGLVNNAINYDFNSNVIYIIYSTLLYTICLMASYKTKYVDCTWRQICMEALNGIMLGGYLSFVLIKTQTLATVIITHGYLNFMGTPNFEDLFSGDLTGQIKQNTIRFYFMGVAAFMILCMFIL